MVFGTFAGMTSAPVQRLLGPMGAVVLYRLLSVVSLAAIAFSAELGLGTPAIATCCLVRGGFMNAVGGITEAVLIDHTSEGHRGKWQIIQRVSDSTWSGAALVGGFLVDRIGYRRAFMAPFGFQLLGTIVLLPLMRVVRADKLEKAADT